MLTINPLNKPLKWVLLAPFYRPAEVQTSWWPYRTPLQVRRERKKALSFSDSKLMIFLYVCLLCFLAHASWLVPWPGIKPMSPAVKAQGPNHWTTRGVPKAYALNHYNILTNIKNPKMGVNDSCTFQVQASAKSYQEILWNYLTKHSNWPCP